MVLNARNNGFVFLFSPDFFADEVKEKYKKYYQSLILPYDKIEDFMSSTVQQFEFPGWSMDTVEQTRLFGKKQDYKSSVVIPELFTREFTITFKLTDSYLNYFIFLDNALNYLDFNNKKQTFSPMELVLLNNEGYMISSIVFNNPILKSQDSLKLSYSSNTPDFKTFTAKFKYFNFDLNINFD